VTDGGIAAVEAAASELSSFCSKENWMMTKKKMTTKKKSSTKERIQSKSLIW